MQSDVSFHIYISLEIRVAIAKITIYVISVKITKKGIISRTLNLPIDSNRFHLSSGPFTSWEGVQNRTCSKSRTWVMVSRWEEYVS
jgi:hypothetical protein